MRFKNCVAVESVGFSGRICLMWSSNVELDIIHLSRSMIVAQIRNMLGGPDWLFIRFYSPCKGKAKLDFWEEITSIISAFGGPWLAVGDWNDIVSPREKMGGTSIASCSNSHLAKFMDSSGGIDLGFSGPKFTWSNKQGRISHVKERLDRAIANVGWCSMFPKAAVSHLPDVSSDHNPVFLELFGQTDVAQNRFVSLKHGLGILLART